MDTRTVYRHENRGTVLFLAAMVLTTVFLGCHKKEEPLSPAYRLLSDFREKAGDRSPEEIADMLITQDWIPFAGASAEVNEGFLNGFTKEITGFKRGAVFSPMIGSIPFIGYIFETDDGVDTASFLKELSEYADLRWNVCTQADEMVMGASGRMVFFVMSPLSFDEAD